MLSITVIFSKKGVVTCYTSTAYTDYCLLPFVQCASCFNVTLECSSCVEPGYCTDESDPLDQS